MKFQTDTEIINSTAMEKCKIIAKVLYNVL